MEGNFTEESRSLLISAKEEMYKLKHSYVGTEHLLLAILKSNLKNRLNKYNITYEIALKNIKKIVGVGTKETDLFLYTPVLKRIIENSIIDSKDNNTDVTPEILFLNFLEEGEGVGIRILLISNIFMTFAWYGHLRFRSLPILIVILASWGIAFFEYCFQVPANRIGYDCYNAVQLKTIQEVITLTVFSFFSVSVWVQRLPVPAVAAHILKVIVRRPAEHIFALLRTAVADVDIAGAPAHDSVRHAQAVCLLKGVHHVEHAVADAGAEVKHAFAAMAFHVRNGGDMAAGEIDDMDVIAHAGAVVGVVVVAENAQILELADGGLRDIGHEVIRYAPGILADETAGMSADGVEIAQQHYAPRGVSLYIVAQYLLAHKFCPAVGVGTAAGARCLVQGHLVVC